MYRTYHMFKACVCKYMIVTDGYWGRRSRVGLALVDGKAFEVYDFGVMLSPRLMGMTFSTESEMVKAALASGYFEEEKRNNPSR